MGNDERGTVDGITRTTITRTTVGHSWVTGDRAPVVPGWKCVWVNHYGTERTVWVYRRAV
jgi:hypothetical protein